MTRFQRLLSAHLILVMGAPFAGCNTGDSRPDTWCLDIEAEDECPTVEEINDEHLPSGWECGGGAHMWAQDFEYRGEGSAWGWWGDSGDSGDPGVDHCCYDTAWRNTVRGQGCVVGRPLIERGQARLPELRRAPSPWLSGPHPLLADLSTEQRQQLATHWLEAARTEHASVASFNHLALALMAHGAPPALLLGAQQAASDEIRHAQACFTLASAYAGGPFSPGALDASLPIPDLVQLALESARDGAINETLAAVQAAFQLSRATDPAVRAALQRIVVEESRHAELAWETLRWCLQVGGAPVLEALDALFEEMASPAAEAFPHHSDHALIAHGLPPGPQVEERLSQALDAVVRPTWRALRTELSPLA